jgi:hypothetical protein
MRTEFIVYFPASLFDPSSLAVADQAAVARIGRQSCFSPLLCTIGASVDSVDGYRDPYLTHRDLKA